MTKLIIDLITSKNPLLEDSDPCWDNYKQIGLKKKDGKTVPNCVPQEKTNMKAIRVSEKLSVSAGMGAWIKDFQDSDAPQFADADEDERRTMAIAAFLAAKRESKKSVEKEEEQVDELKTGTLLRYASKAGKDGLSKGIAAARASDMDDSEAAALLRQKRDKRYAGQNQALNKIRSKVTKEEVEIKEDELSQKKKEEVVTVRHKDSGKELSIVKTAVADYQKRGYYPVKESTSEYAQSANKILDDLKKANISAADKAKLAKLADLMAKMKDK